jgi:hypothetical protein
MVRKDLNHRPGLPLVARRGAIVGLILAAAACYPGDGPTNVQDLDVVITVYDQDVDFAGFHTYAMPDSVVYVGRKLGTDIVELSRENDELILDVISENMASAGYIREFDPGATGADLILLVGAIGVENTEYWVYQDWWSYYGWYPGWGYGGYPGYGAGWGWYYPPTYVGSTSFEQGTLVLTLVDPTAGDTSDNSVPVVWGGAVRGLLNYGGEAARLTRNINKLFTQSPYLGR